MSTGMQTLLNQCKDQDRKADSAQHSDQPVFVPATAHEDCEARCRQDEEDHPQMEILVHKKAGGDDRQRDNQDRRQQAVNRTNGSHPDRETIKPSVAPTCAGCRIVHC